MLPEKWVTDTCPEVLKYLNKKYNRNLIGLCFYYGETNAQEYFEGDYYPKNYTYLTKEQFLEMTTEKEVWKKGDILFNGIVYRKILYVLDENIFFTTNAYTDLKSIENCSTVEPLSKKYLENKDFKVYNIQPSSITVTLTLEEIANKFNVDVKNLKIKNNE